MSNNDLRKLNPKTKKKVLKQSLNYMVIEGVPYSLEGENLSEKYGHSLNVKESDKIKESKRLLRNHEKENGGFVFLFFKIGIALKETIPALSKPDITRLLYLFTFIDYENKLMKKNNTPIHKNDLSNLLKLSTKRLNEFIKKLNDAEILSINENDEIIIHNWIATTGAIDKNALKRNNSSYIRLFRKTVQELFENTNTRDLGRLATIYLILPCLNLATNIISHNPDEKDIDNVKPMKLVELAEMLEYSDYRKLKSALNKIKIGNEYAFGFVEFEGDRRTMRIIVNPRIVFAGNYEQLQIVKALFK